MAFDRIDGALLKEMILNGAAMLESRKAEINQLNVFPVPDGDTGTNMALTMANACREVQALQQLTCHTVADALARGALKGARGNSGVILSQLFRGFARGVDGLLELDAKQFAEALKSGVETAYKAVMKPREGTILTVSRAFADDAARQAARSADIAAVMEGAMAFGELTLSKTPEMLDVLKKAGVVDAGGKGLLVIYQGFLYSLHGNGLLSLDQKAEPAAQEKQPVITGSEAIEKGYCTEFLIENLKPEVDIAAVERMRDRLDRLGDSVVLVHDDGMLKVHVHTESPDKVLMFALQLGELMQIKIENMREQNRQIGRVQAEAAKAPAAPKEQGVVAVAAGDGIKGIFHDIMVEGFVEGGQTMNPSAEDIATAIRAVNARNVIVLPNNPNIILAANQAAELVDCKVFVVPTKTVPQGISAALAYNPQASAEENAENMGSAIGSVKSGSVTYAVRDSAIDGIEIRKGDVLAIGDHGISGAGADMTEVTLGMIRSMVDENSCMISLYWGADVKKEDAVALRDRVRRQWPQCDAEAYAGGQPIYYYLVSVE